MVGTMNRAGRKIHKERFAGIEGFAGPHPLNGFFRHVLGQVILGVVWCLDRIGIFKQHGFVLGGFSGDKSIEVIKSKTRGKTVKRSQFSQIRHRRIVPFAESRSVVAIIRQHLGNRSR